MPTKKRKVKKMSNGGKAEKMIRDVEKKIPKSKRRKKPFGDNQTYNA